MNFRYSRVLINQSCATRQPHRCRLASLYFHGGVSLTRLKDSIYVERPATFFSLFDIGAKEKLKNLLAVDHLARASMKDAASCEK